MLSLQVIAQGDSDMDDRKIRFGLTVAPNFGWLKPNIPEFDKDGLQPRMGFGYGLMMDYKFSESPNYLFSTGFNLTTNGGGMIEPWETVITESDTSYRYLGHNDRTYRLQYINVPLLLKMRTSNVGYMTYFGAIGLDVGFRTRARINNDYTWTTSSISALQPADEKDLDFNSNLNFMRLALNITLGTEYNLTGNTNLYAGIGLHNGFTNLFNNKPANRILDPDNNGSPKLDLTGSTIVSQQKKAGYYYISLDLGVFF
ncbi:MAG: porin family protein [Flavobacteriales bacterium]